MVIKGKWSLVRVHSHGNMKEKLSERNGHKRQVVLGEGSFTWELKGKPSERNGHERQVVLGEGSFMLDYEEKAFRWSLVRVHSCWTMKGQPSAFRWSLVRVHSHENMKGKPSEKSGLKRRVASHRCISIRAVFQFHQGGLSLGWSFCFTRGLTIPVNLE